MERERLATENYSGFLVNNIHFKSYINFQGYYNSSLNWWLMPIGINFSHISGHWKSNIKLLASLIPSEASLLALHVDNLRPMPSHILFAVQPHYPTDVSSPHRTSLMLDQSSKSKTSLNFISKYQFPNLGVDQAFYM